MNRKDLVVLAADKDMEYALKGLLSRPQALGIRAIEADIRVHPGHDPACAGRGVEYLSSFSEYYHYGLLLFDHEGSGREQTQPQALQEALNRDFVHSAWGERARAIVLSPELEVWVWSNSPHIDDVAGWKDRQPSLRSWMVEQGWLEEGEVKPRRPKEALQAALREARIPRSPSLYQRIAERVSLRRCEDRAFLKFKDILGSWFPRDSQY